MPVIYASIVYDCIVDEVVSEHTNEQSAGQPFSEHTGTPWKESIGTVSGSGLSSNGGTVGSTPLLAAKRVRQLLRRVKKRRKNTRSQSVSIFRKSPTQKFCQLAHRCARRALFHPWLLMIFVVRLEARHLAQAVWEISAKGDRGCPTSMTLPSM